MCITFSYPLVTVDIADNCMSLDKDPSGSGSFIFHLFIEYIDTEIMIIDRKCHAIMDEGCQ